MAGKADFKKPREMKGYCCPWCDGPEKKYKKVRARRTRQKTQETVEERSLQLPKS